MQIDALLRALADPSRLRVMRLIAHMELSVGELAQVLGQSQPRVSQHVGKLVDAGLAERQREGNSVYLRLVARGGARSPVGDSVARLLAIAEREDAEFAAQCEADRDRLASIRADREKDAEAYFARHAEDWDTLRERHGPERPVEEALVAALGSGSLGRLLDIGTGTGRMAELLAPRAVHITALDKSLDMLRVARAKLQGLGPGRVELTQGDFTALPFPARHFDTVLLHQVLHFAQDPLRALKEAARVMRPGGRLAVIDLAKHDREELRQRHAHARLGFSDNTMRLLLAEAGFEPRPPVTVPGHELTVNIWTARREGSLVRPDTDFDTTTRTPAKEAAQ